MSTSQLYHYVYRITNVVERKHYYGKRSSKVSPKEDLGIKYFSSSRDKEFLQDQKQNPQNYKYKVVGVYSSAEKAVTVEIKLHSRFDVGVNKSFYNKVKQTSTSFDNTGVIFSEETRKRMKLAQLNHPVSEETKAKLRLRSLGKTHSQETIEKMRKSRLGSNNYKSKYANIYDRYTDELIAENVILSEWCRANPTYSNSTLSYTARADRSKPSSNRNPHFYKGLYAKYV